MTLPLDASVILKYCVPGGMPVVCSCSPHWHELKKTIISINAATTTPAAIQKGVLVLALPCGMATPP
jgi:hypothetical protein